MHNHPTANSLSYQNSQDQVHNPYTSDSGIDNTANATSSASPFAQEKEQSPPKCLGSSLDYWVRREASKTSSLVKAFQKVHNPRSSQVLTVWPSGDFSIGNAAPPKTDKGEHPLDGFVLRLMPWTKSDDPEYFNYMLESGARPFEVAFQNREPPRSDRQLSQQEALKLWELIQKAEERGQKIPLEEIQRVLDAIGDMGLSVPRNFNAGDRHSKNNRPERYGGKGITSYGKKMLRSACTELEEKFGRSCVAFLTCTLPSLSVQEIDLVASEWHVIINRFLSWFRRTVPKTLAFYAYCTEIQEQRTRLNGGHPVPHLHMVFVSRESPDQDYLVTKEQIRDSWKRAIQATIKREVNCDYATRVETPRGSLKKEIAKYLSKGGRGVKKAIEAGFAHLLPKQWWGAARELTRIVKGKIKRFQNETTDVVVDSLEKLARTGILKYQAIKVKRPITKSNGDHQIDPSTGEPLYGEIIVGYSGYFLVENPLQFMVTTSDEMEIAIARWINNYNLSCNKRCKGIYQQKMAV